MQGSDEKTCLSHRHRAFMTYRTRAGHRAFKAVRLKLRHHINIKLLRICNSSICMLFCLRTSREVKRFANLCPSIALELVPRHLALKQNSGLYFLFYLFGFSFFKASLLLLAVLSLLGHGSKRPGLTLCNCRMEPKPPIFQGTLNVAPILEFATKQRRKKQKSLWMVRRAMTNSRRRTPSVSRWLLQVLPFFHFIFFLSALTAAQTGANHGSGCSGVGRYFTPKKWRSSQQ